MNDKIYKVSDAMLETICDRCDLAPCGDCDFIFDIEELYGMPEAEGTCHDCGLKRIEKEGLYEITEDGLRINEDSPLTADHFEIILKECYGSLSSFGFAGNSTVKLVRQALLKYWDSIESFALFSERNGLNN